MAPEEVFFHRLRRQARSDPATTLVQLYLYLENHRHFELDFDRKRCEAEAKDGLAALRGGESLPRLHPAAALRAVDEYLVDSESGAELWVRKIVLENPPAGVYQVVARRPGWGSRLATQPGHREFWMRRHQIVPANHRGLELEVSRLPQSTAQALAAGGFGFVCGGFQDAILPDWNNTSPYRCSKLTNAAGRWNSLKSLLSEAARQGARLVLLPELTIDAEVRDELCQWLRDQAGSHSISLVVAGSFYETFTSANGVEPRYHNVCRVLDGFGGELLRHVKLRPMRITPSGEACDEGLESGWRVGLLAASFGLVGVAVCLDFCDAGGTAVADLWKQAGPALMLVPSMGTDSTNHAHEARAKELALQHGTVTLVASQHPQEPRATGFHWNNHGQPSRGEPHLEGAVDWLPG